MDFKQAFDRINHRILWQKLAKLGLPQKYIRILAAFYNSARVRVAVNQNKHTEPINIHNGVLQGDCLSPLLFNLLIIGLELLLESRGLDGVGMGPKWSIVCLFYADDLVLFARSRAQLQAMLNCLSEFCADLCMTVNAAKTKVVVFSAKKTPVISNFSINGEVVEVVREFCYLGVTFSSNGRFQSHLNIMKRNSALATASIAKILLNCKKMSHEVHMTIHNSKALSALLYCAEIWAINQIKGLEQIQNQHFKRLFFLHNTTPEYAIRLFFNCPSQHCIIIKKALAWYNRVCSMSPVRWPLKCMNLLVSRCGSHQGANLNWYYQLRSLIGDAGIELSVDPDSGHLSIANIMDTYTSHRLALDQDRIQRSTHCPQLVAGLPTAASLHGHLNLEELRIAYPLILFNTQFQSMYWKGTVLRLHPTLTCPRCNSGKDTIEHILLHCKELAIERMNCGIPPDVVSLPVLFSKHMLHCVIFIKKLCSSVSTVSPPP